MGDIFVVVEHRQGEVREITFEMLKKGSDLCEAHGHTLSAVLLGGKSEAFEGAVAGKADRVIVVEDDQLANFNGELYKGVLASLIEEHGPVLTLMGHTPWGMDYAPGLSVKTGLPLATDCVDVQLEDGGAAGIRQIYNGKIFCKVALKASPGYLVSMRPGAISHEGLADRQGEVVKTAMPEGLSDGGKEFIAYEDAGAGEIDITQADLLISIGRGIGEAENVETVKELAEMMGGVLSCSRPVVDKNWLPKYHQVGTSGKSVKPKVYLAFGISGAFQHVAGIGGAGTVIAVNKDKKAPIFRVAHYGVAEDLFKVVDAMKEKLKG
ncbi:MAG: electron transfer flavoprotein subunit alpha/FixB family protein [Deltaproteobacteria bacterium]|nr:electron transfer flavoprotein subunit alpha/FixB family protein [Deltaproteobacteria bacterium]MBW1942996.1 electron transfer flavoprotein subunit alpha/FixB family protein [Deltaproteobacteria bacterium]